MKLYYPNDADKQEYVESITTAYKEKHPNLDEKKIKKMIEIVVTTLERILVPNMAVIQDQTCCRNVEILPILFDLSFDDYTKLKPIPSESFKRLRFLALRPKAIIPRILRLQGKGYESFWTEIQSKEEFAQFITEMTKQCSYEIALKTKANIPYELCQRYNKTPPANILGKQDNLNYSRESTKPKKTVTWKEEINSNPLITCHCSHFKRPRDQQSDKDSFKDGNVLKKLRTDSLDKQQKREEIISMNHIPTPLT